MALDPYGFPTEGAPVRPRSLLARFGVTLVWLLFVDLVVGVCTAGFAALVWSDMEDPPFIAFFSSPFWGFALGGTGVALVGGALRAHPAVQAVLSLLAAGVGFLGLPTLWFVAMVIAEL